MKVCLIKINLILLNSRIIKDERLKTVLKNMDNVEIVSELKKNIPEYISKNSIYESLDELEESTSYFNIAS